MAVMGVVCGYHANLPRYAIRTDDGFAIVDVLVGELRIGDSVRGALDNNGMAMLINRTTGELVEVAVEAVHASQDAAESLLRSK